MLNRNERDAAVMKAWALALELCPNDRRHFDRHSVHHLIEVIKAGFQAGRNYGHDHVGVVERPAGTGSELFERAEPLSRQIVEHLPAGLEGRLLSAANKLGNPRRQILKAFPTLSEPTLNGALDECLLFGVALALLDNQRILAEERGEAPGPSGSPVQSTPWNEPDLRYVEERVAYMKSLSVGAIVVGELARKDEIGRWAIWTHLVLERVVRLGFSAGSVYAAERFGSWAPPSVNRDERDIFRNSEALARGIRESLPQELERILLSVVKRHERLRTEPLADLPSLSPFVLDAALDECILFGVALALRDQPSALGVDPPVPEPQDEPETVALVGLELRDLSAKQARRSAQTQRPKPEKNPNSANSGEHDLSTGLFCTIAGFASSVVVFLVASNLDRPWFGLGIKLAAGLFCLGGLGVIVLWSTVKERTPRP